MVERTHAITSRDKIALAYGAFCGIALMLYASGNIVVAILLGVPPGLFAITCVLLVHKRLGVSMHSPRHVTRSRRTVILLVILLSSFAAGVHAALLHDTFRLLILLLTFGPIVYFGWLNVRAGT